MEKDPAFLFYSKDWLEGTAEMLPHEKGVFIDLLAHHHQKESLPADTTRLARLARMSHDEFLPIWAAISSKFVPAGTPSGTPAGDASGARIVNKKLVRVMKERQDNAQRSRVVGVFAAVLKKLDVTPDQRKAIKQQFQWADFKNYDGLELTSRLTLWCTSRCGFTPPSLADANANADTVKEKGGSGEKGTWNQFPGEDQHSEIQLRPDEVQKSIEYYRSIRGQPITSETVASMFHAFKLAHLTGTKFYQHRGEVFSHFLNWLKNQRTHVKSSTASTATLEGDSYASKL